MRRYNPEGVLYGNWRRNKYESRNISYTKVVMDVWNQIESLYNIDEKHKCYGYLVAQKMERPVKKCTHLVANGVLCSICDYILRNFISLQTKEMNECSISTCNSRRKHLNIFSLHKCQCFVTVQDAPIKEYLTLLMVMKRIGCKLPRDIRRYVLYPHCVPRGYYITDNEIHTVTNVRTTKQDLINGVIPDCSILLKTFTVQNTQQFLRMKYAVLNKLKTDPRATHVDMMWYLLLPSKNSYSLELMELAKKMGFTLCNPEPHDGKKIRISWDYSSTSQFDGNLLRTDPKYDLLTL